MQKSADIVQNNNEYIDNIMNDIKESDEREKAKEAARQAAAKGGAEDAAGKANPTSCEISIKEAPAHKFEQYGKVPGSPHAPSSPRASSVVSSRRLTKDTSFRKLHLAE